MSLNVIYSIIKSFNQVQHTSKRVSCPDLSQHIVDARKLKVDTSKPGARKLNYFNFEQLQSSTALHNTRVKTDIFSFCHKQKLIQMVQLPRFVFYPHSDLSNEAEEKGIPFRLADTNTPLFGTQMLGVKHVKM